MSWIIRKTKNELWIRIRRISKKMRNKSAEAVDVVVIIIVVIDTLVVVVIDSVAVFIVSVEYLLICERY